MHSLRFTEWRLRPAKRLRTLVGSAILSSSLGLAAVGDGVSIQIRDVHGGVIQPFAPSGAANVIFFIQSDCPISNGYAPEIQRVCREYANRGVGCSLMYEDFDTGRTPAPLDAAVRKHVKDFGYGAMPAAVDRTRAVARQAHVRVTPQAVVVDRTGAIRYSGRIDNFYAALGKPRQQVTVRDLREALDAVLAGRPVPRPKTDALGCYIYDPSSLEK